MPSRAYDLGFVQLRATAGDGSALGIAPVDPSELVLGNLLSIERGTLVPADARLIDCNDLAVNDAPLPGRSVTRAPVPDRRNMLFGGTAVTGGSGFAVVTATGLATEIGRIHGPLGSVRPSQTLIQRQLGEVGRELIVVNGLI